MTHQNGQSQTSQGANSEAPLGLTVPTGEFGQRLTQWRDLGLAQARALAFPTRKVESYRYLNLKGLREVPWDAGIDDHIQRMDWWLLRSRIQELILPGWLPVVFLNGRWIGDLWKTPGISGPISGDLEISNWWGQPHASQGLHLNAGDDSQLTTTAQGAAATLQTLAIRESAFDWWQKFPAAIGEVNFKQDYFDGLNQSYWGRGALLRLSGQTEQKLQLLFLTAAQDGRPTWSPFQVGIDVQPGSRWQVFEQHFSLRPQDPTEQWQQPELRIQVREKSELQWSQWQGLPAHQQVVERSRFVVDSGAQLKALHMAAGGTLSRQNIDIHIIGAAGNVELNGITMAGGGQTVDFHTFIDHAAGGSSTTQLYKGILGADTQAVFNGRVLIRKGSQKASSEQLNQNLLLSDRAEIDSKPELEIFADDVKATHGSAIGQLSEEEVFYCLSRAIPLAEAKEMIALGSVLGLLQDIPDVNLKKALQVELSKAYRRLDLTSQTVVPSGELQ